jgi:SAM-dependent methyltransferase
MLGAELDVIDMSCGPGTHCFMFAEICHQVTAVDVSKKMIERVEQKKESQGVENLVVICQDFNDFQAPDLYDTVFVSMSPILNDLSNIDRLLAMSRRYLVLSYWAGVRENPLFQRCYRLIFNSEYCFDALDLTIVFNYLNALGFSPEISYSHPVWQRCDTWQNTVTYILWHLEFYRDLSDSEKQAVQELVVAEADREGLVTYSTKVRKGVIFLDKKAGLFAAK